MTSRRTLVFALIGCSALLMVSATQVWVEYELDIGAAAVEEVSLSGADTRSGIFPISVALIAIAVTLSIAGKVARIVLASLSMLLGLWAAVFSIARLTDDAQALIELGSPVLHEVTGLGSSEHSQLVLATHTSIWPFVAALAGSLVVLTATLMLVFGHTWSAVGRKYESRQTRTQHSNQTDRIGDWDALTEGDDPSQAEASPAESNFSAEHESGSTDSESNR